MHSIDKCWNLLPLQCTTIASAILVVPPELIFADFRCIARRQIWSSPRIITVEHKFMKHKIIIYNWWIFCVAEWYSHAFFIAYAVCIRTKAIISRCDFLCGAATKNAFSHSAGIPEADLLVLLLLAMVMRCSRRYITANERIIYFHCLCWYPVAIILRMPFDGINLFNGNTEASHNQHQHHQ